MATGGLTLLAKRDAYMMYAKQSAWGTPVTPTQGWRWLRGSGHQPNATFQKEREGDSQIYTSLIYKTAQYHVIKVVEYGRPVTLGCAVQALLGTGSDSLTTAAKSTTLSGSGNTAGSTTVAVVGDLGNTGTLAVHINPGTPGSYTTTYEVVTLDCTSRSGAGPYTYTIASSGTLRFGHSAAEVVRSTSSHALTGQRTTYDPYTIEVGYGVSGNAPQLAFRYTDAVCTDLTITSGPGATPVKLEHTWYACTVQQKTALTSNPQSVYEGTNIPGYAGGPLLHSMAGSSWALDGASTGNAATIKQAKLTLKRAVNPGAFITEGVTPNYWLLPNLDISLTLSTLFQSYTQYREAYLNSSSANSAGDAYQTVFGTAAWTYTGDAANSLAISLANAAYTMAQPPAMDDTGDPMEMQIQLDVANSPSVQTPLTFTLANSQNTAY